MPGTAPSPESRALIPESPYYERYRRVHRPLSTQFNPAALATYLQFATPLAFHAARTTRGSLRAVAGTAVALDLTCLLLTFSRGGFSGLAPTAVGCYPSSPK